MIVRTVSRIGRRHGSCRVRGVPGDVDPRLLRQALVANVRSARSSRHDTDDRSGGACEQSPALDATHDGLGLDRRFGLLGDAIDAIDAIKYFRHRRVGQILQSKQAVSSYAATVVVVVVEIAHGAQPDLLYSASAAVALTRGSYNWAALVMPMLASHVR